MRTGALKYLQELRILARTNRKNPTETEKIFWIELRKNKYRFLRQKAVGKFILDFYCSKLLLAIEIDGESHNLRQYIDNERDVYFKNREVKTVRIKKEMVLRGKLKELIEEIVKKREKEMKKWL